MHRVMRSPKKIGFTLIELLVVMLIIGIIASFVMLAYNIGDRSKQVESTARKLMMLLTFAEHQAILQPAVLGFKVNRHTYVFLRYDLTANQGQWLPLTHDQILGMATIPAGIDVMVKLASENQTATPPSTSNLSTDSSVTPDIIFLPSGEIKPFAIEVSAANVNTYYRLKGTANGFLQLLPVKAK